MILLKLKAIIEVMDDHLQVFLFLLAGMGLLIGSFFVYTSHVTGSDWVMLCGILFGSNSIGHSVTKWKGRETYWQPRPRDSDMDNGRQRPQ